MVAFESGESTKQLGLKEAINAEDVAIHEMSHVILAGIGGLRPNNMAERAVHESFSDVAAALATGDWQIGESIIADTSKFPRGALRDLTDPVVKHASELTAKTTPYQQAELIGNGVFRASQDAQSGEIASVWLDTFVNRIKDDKGSDEKITIDDIPRLTVKSSSEQFGADSSTTTALVQAWTALGFLGQERADEAPPLRKDIQE